MSHQAMARGNMTGELAMKLLINIKHGAQRDMKEGSLKLQGLYIRSMILD